jgi:polyisoprenoid-binding protein YceI
MKKLLIGTSLLLLVIAASAQKYMTKDGYIGFYSHTAMEDIKADNNQVAGALDAATGEMVFQVLIKSFHFERALMQEHFNENYMDSEKFPKAVFKGKITDPAKPDLSKKGSINVTVSGDLTIKDVTKQVSVKGTIEVLEDGIKIDSKFDIVPEDYNITIPSVVREKINKTMAVTVNMKLTPVNSK